jgi:hypothetical protein
MDITGLTNDMEKEYTDNKMWVGSPFEWIHNKPPATKGSIGRKIVERISINAGIVVSKLKKKTADVDTVLNLIPTEVKMCMLWANGDIVFEQLRNQSYEVAALLALLPSGKSYLWIIPKDILLSHAKIQHDPKKGTDTWWLIFSSNAVPEWMSEYGGEIEVALSYLKAL